MEQVKAFPLLEAAKRYFGFEEAGTNLRTELLAGLTTFLTMAYIIFVNPAILGDAGMPKDSVFVATCLVAAIATLIMGLYANYPIACHPGELRDTMIAGIVLASRATLATHDVKHFEDIASVVVDPWSE